MKSVCEKYQRILQNPTMVSLMDASQNILPVLEEIQSWWGYDLFSRRPGPAYREDGTFQGTDLDMACFLYELLERGAVINIPNYKSMRPAHIKEGEIITSNENRHGKIVSVLANREVFTFSVRILDANVMSSNSTGEARTFCLTDPTGRWYRGWDVISFLPTFKENEFLHENNLLTGNKIIFKNFSHPNRWTSVYGEKYFITKYAIERATSEASYYDVLIKRMIQEGITNQQEKEVKEFPSGPKVKTEQGKPIQVQAFQIEVDVPQNNTVFQSYESSQENLAKLIDLKKRLTYGIIPKLRFMTRASELSYYLYGMNNLPSWLKDYKWEDYTVPGKRIHWDRLVLCDENEGIPIALRRRLYTKTETVSENCYLD